MFYHVGLIYLVVMLHILHHLVRLSYAVPTHVISFYKVHYLPSYIPFILPAEHMASKLSFFGKKMFTAASCLYFCKFLYILVLIYSTLILFFFFFDKSKTRQTPPNPCHGCGFSRGCDLQTRTRTPPTRTRDPSRVTKPVTIPKDDDEDF